VNFHLRRNSIKYSKTNRAKSKLFQMPINYTQLNEKLITLTKIINIHIFRKPYFSNSLLFCKMRFSLQDQIHKLDLQINSNKTYASARVQQTLGKILTIQELFKLFILPFFLLEIISIFPFY
jgi:hypothetical protein